MSRTIKVIGSKLSKLSDFPQISVIIPTADGYRDGYFLSLLQQLSQQTYQNFETIIIKGDPRQGRAINMGVDIARGKYLLTLDDDTRLISQDAFERLLRVLENNEDIGMAGGINKIPESVPLFVQEVMKEIPRRSTPPVNEVTESDLAEHPLLLIRKDVFKIVGGENELLPRGLDPYLRSEFRKAGYKVVVVPKVYYSHLPPPTMVKLIRQFFRNGKMAAYCNKFFPQWLLETPDHHVNNFIGKRPFYFRAVRYILNMLKNCIKGRWIYLSVYLAYAFGFGWGYIRFKITDQA
ncbi:MAG: glycosyltransferase [Candidatus Hodarchaeales archaeon]